MKLIENFIKSYISRKLKYETFNTLISFILAILSVFLIFIFLEKNAYFNPLIKQKFFSLIYSVIFVFTLFLLLKIIIHKNNIFNNSNYSKIAIELIQKISTKDRIINALQIYSKVDKNDPYSDLTFNAINNLENELKEIDVKQIDFHINKINIYALVSMLLVFTYTINNNIYFNAYNRLINKKIEFTRDIPFSLKLENSDSINHVYKGENLKIIINSKGDSPDKIDFFIKSKNFSKKFEQHKNNNNYQLNLNDIKEESMVWGVYTNDPLLSFNKYSVVTDTLNIKIKKRPEIKKLDVTIIPPDYTNVDQVDHNQSIKQIEILEGSKLKINAVYDKNIKDAYISFNQDSLVKINSTKNSIETIINVLQSFDLELSCTDYENYNSIPINYKIIKLNDMQPQALIKFPETDLKLNDIYDIPLEIEVIDDFGINTVYLEYNINKPYYLTQDTVKYKFIISKDNQSGKRNLLFQYNWIIKNLNLSPGDEIIYWITAHDNKKNKPNIGQSKKLRAYIPSLEDLYFEIEEEQHVIENDFDDMLNSVDDLKSMYDNISKDILKEQSGLEQAQEISSMSQELQQISEKIKNLESTIETIEELNDKNNLINDHLGEKIKKLQNIFKDMLNSDLMNALEELQNSMNKDDFTKSLEQLNNLDFEIDDLETQLDRMIDLFEQVVAEQKLNELLNKIDKMTDFQDKISDKIDKNPKEKNIDPMLNMQKENMLDFDKNLEQARSLSQSIDSNLENDIKNLIENQKSSEINNLLSQMSKDKNKKSMADKSNKIEEELSEIKNELDNLINKYQDKSTLEMLNLFSRIIKNLIDMSYQQEQLITLSKNFKSKKDDVIYDILKDENILMQQYKSVFLQISDLSKKSFHISAETSKTFSQIFVCLSKTIAGFEQGKISEAKKNQLNAMIYMNETVLQLINAMDDMQSSGEASGYSQYLESMEQLMSGQQQINQGMNSLIPMPFGQEQSGQGLMQSLMQQQQQLKNQLEKLIDENSTSPTDMQGDGLGKALDDMDKILEDFRKDQITQESIDRGQQVYRKLLEHKNAAQNRGYDNKWEAKEDEQNQWNQENNAVKNSLSMNLKKLYKTLDEVDNNKNISTENKKIIQEYLKILIDEKINEQ